MKKIYFLLFILLSFVGYSQTKKIKTTEITVNSLIKGTLFSLDSTSKKPNLVILIAGSGPTDRNGNQESSGNNNSLKFLAEGLTDKKTSVFSYDKRILQQMKDKNSDEKSLRFDDMITDACDVVAYFKSTKAVGKIIIAGHSEGALVGMITAQRTQADGYISLAGAGRTIDEVLMEQIEKNLTILKDESAKVMQSLKNGKTVTIENPLMNLIFRESVQPYLISWIALNPQEEIKKINAPLLIVNGTKDLQVPQSEALLLHKANPKSELFIVENMNHVLKEIRTDEENLASYSNPNLPVMPELIDRIRLFLKKIN